MEETAMAKTGTRLLMVWTDIDAEFEPEFNRWYDREHLPRLLQIPGFLSAGRYSALRGGPKYLAIYELEDNVLRSSALKYQPSAVRQKTGTSRIGRNFLRNAYRQIFPVHTHPIEQTAGMASPADGADRRFERGRRGLQRLVQHRLHPGLSGGHGRTPLYRCRGPTQIPDPLRVRTRQSAGE
jgi:hypothetical protein